MSKTEALRFFDDISSGKLVIDAAEILGKGTHNDVYEYAKSVGYDFSKSELLQVINEKGLVGDGEISEEQLEALVGGAVSVAPVVVVGVVVEVVVTAAASAAVL